VLKVLVSTASFGEPLQSTWVQQTSDKYSITYNRVSADTETARLNAMHPRLRAKIPKMLAHETHPDYDYYVWADSRFCLVDATAIEKLVDECIGVDACFFNHRERSSVQQELDFVVNLMADGHPYLVSRYAGEKMQEQVEHYQKDAMWQDNKLFECGIFVYAKTVIANREHNLLKEWFYHNCIWSVQDQLSLPYLIHKIPTSYKILAGNVMHNSFFVWY
jgi:hypothetical protein